MELSVSGVTVNGVELRAAVVDENQVRAAAGLTMVMGAVAFSLAYFNHQYILLQVVSTFFFVEFLTRLTVGLSVSPIGVVARAMTVREVPDWVSEKPKRFAWTLGLGMTFAMAIITEAVGKVARRPVCPLGVPVALKGARRARPAISGGAGGEVVAVELEEIVGGGDQSPFRPAGRSAAALEALDHAVELELAEHRLDRDLALAVERPPAGRGEHTPHEVIEAAGPARTRALA